MLVLMILIGVYFDVDIFMMISMLILMFNFITGLLLLRKRGTKESHAVRKSEF